MRIPTTTRFVVALDLDIGVVERLVLLQEELADPVRQLGCDVMWTAPDALRMTVSTHDVHNDAETERFRDALRVIAKTTSPISVQVAGTQLFPSESLPRMIVVGTRDGADALDRLHGKLEAAASASGWNPLGAYKPWIRIGRIRGSDQRPMLQGITSPYAETVYGTSYVKEISLYRSSVVRGEPRLEVRERMEFGTGK